LWAGVHFVAEGARLAIEIGEVGKRAPGQKIMFDEMKRPLDAGRPVRIALFVGAEDKAEALRERRHLGRRDHARARTGGDHDVRIVNHAGRGRPGHVLDRVGQEDLAIEAREDRVGVEEEQARVAQDQRGRLDALLDAADQGAVRRGVMLHLLGGREIVVAHGRRRDMSDRVPPAKGGQRGVGHHHALRDELLVDADQIAAAAIDPLEDLIAVRRRLLGAFNPRDGRTARPEDAPNRPTGDLQRPGDLTNPVALGL